LLLLSIVGIGVGGLTVPYDTLAEYVPNAYRGTTMLSLNYFWTFGSMMALSAAYISLNYFHSWRVLVVVTSIPCWVSAFAGWYLVPETPRWLCAHGKFDQALETLRQGATQNGHDALQLFPPGTTLVVEVGEEEEFNFQALCLPQWRWIVMNLSGAWAGFGLLYYGTILAITIIFQKNEANSNELDFDYSAIFTSASAEIFGVLLVILTVDRWGRVPSQAWSYIVGGLCASSMCFGSSVWGWHDRTLAVLAFGARLFMMSASCVTWIITPELLTTEVRATGHGVVNAMARVTGILSPFVVQKSRTVAGIVLLITSILSAFCVLQLPETAGRSMGGAGGAASQEESTAEEPLVDQLVGAAEGEEDVVAIG